MPDEPTNKDAADKGISRDKAFDVFISYASRDREVAKRLANELAKHGLRAWIDEYNLKMGEKWEEQIRDAINNSRLCLVLLSNATIPLKPWVSKEWSAIQECSWHRPDFSVCHLELDDVDTPPFLRAWRRVEKKEPFFDFEDIARKIAAFVMLPPEQLAVHSERERMATERRFSEMWEACKQAKNLSEGGDDE